MHVCIYVYICQYANATEYACFYDAIYPNSPLPTAYRIYQNSSSMLSVETGQRRAEVGYKSNSWIY